MTSIYALKSKSKLKLKSKYEDNIDCYCYMLDRGYRNIIGRNEKYKCSKYDKEITASITPKRVEKLIYRREKRLYIKRISTKIN